MPTSKYTYVLRPPGDEITDDAYVYRWYTLTREKYGKKAPSMVFLAAAENLLNTGHYKELGKVNPEIKGADAGINRWTIHIPQDSKLDNVFKGLVQTMSLSYFIRSVIKGGLSESEDEYVAPPTFSDVLIPDLPQPEIFGEEKIKTVQKSDKAEPAKEDTPKQAAVSALDLLSKAGLGGISIE